MLFIPELKKIKSKTHGNFEPIFWNTAWFPTQKPHTLGLLCDPEHPFFSKFPTDYHADWQWWEIMKNSKPMDLNALPQIIQPIIQPIDDWNTCRKLGLLFEAILSEGTINSKIMICSVNINIIHEDQIVLKQFKRAILDYMDSSNFKPTSKISIKELNEMFE